MTSAAAVIPLTYDSHDIQTIPGIFLEIVEGLNEIAEVRGRDNIAPGADGMFFRNRKDTRRKIVLQGFVMGDGADEAAQRSDFRNKVQQLQGWFSAEAAANLVATAEDGSTNTISARTMPPMVWRQRVPSFAEVSIELESVAPNWTVT